MSEQESNRISKFVGLSIIGLIVVIAISTALSFYFTPRLFFPFHFGWLGAIFLIFIVFWAARWFFWPRRGGYYACNYHNRNAESILKERYAKGEITKSVRTALMRDLEGKA